MQEIHELIKVSPEFHMFVAMGAVFVAIIFYATEKFTIENISISLIGFIITFFTIFPLYKNHQNILAPEILLRGFSNSALITVMAMLIIGRAIVLSGSLNAVGNYISKIGNKTHAIISMILTLTAAYLISAAINNTPVVVIFITILSGVAKKLEIPPSKAMMPLAFTASLGGMLTMIGNSTSMLIAAKIKEINSLDMGIFYCILPGSIMSAIGMLYVLFILPMILPNRSSISNQIVGQEKEQKFIAQIDLTNDSEIIGTKLKHNKLECFTEELEVIMLQRGEHAFFYPFEREISIEVGDILVVMATKNTLTEIIKNKPSLILENSYFGEQNQLDNIASKQTMLAEAVIAPASRMIGQTLEQLSFRYFSGTIVLGIQRRSQIIRQKISQIKLRAGDVMLVLGDKGALRNIEAKKDLLLLGSTTEDIPNHNLIIRVNLIAALTITLAITGTVPILVSAILGVTMLIATKSITAQQAVNALDTKVFLVISVAYMMSLAIEKTGGVRFIVEKILGATSGMSPVGIMSILFIIIVLFNELMSNNATGLIFAPIILEIGEQLESDSRLFIWGLIIAGSCCFATPIGYQTNLLVMAPGGYKFTDYIKAGLPLSLLMWVSYTCFAYIYFG